MSPQKYLITEVVEALQVTPELRYAFNERLLEVKANPMRRRLTWDGGSFLVNVGDWLIKCEGGFHTMSDARFQVARVKQLS